MHEIEGTPETLPAEIILEAYSHGLFPMSNAADDPSIFWIDPELRGVLPLGQFHLSRSLQKQLRRNHGVLTVDQAFERVIAACAEATPDRPSTWINGVIYNAYCNLARAGHAHSVEYWLDDELVGGVYGVRIGAAFFAESMFSRISNASKIALVALVARLQAGSFSLLDCQFQNEHIKQFGVIEVPRGRYHAQLQQALLGSADFYSLPEKIAPSDLLQTTGQKS